VVNRFTKILLLDSVDNLRLPDLLNCQNALPEVCLKVHHMLS